MSSNNASINGCRQELCSMWDGDTCPCETFGFDPDNPPASGVFTTIVHTDQDEE